MKPRPLVLSLSIVVAACKPAATPAPVAPEATVATPPVTTVSTTPTPATAAPFSVQVSLSEKARARLATPAETIIVSATYFADPTPSATNKTNDVGQIDLGKAQVELAAPGIATFDGSALLQDRLGLIQGEPQVNINVYSGRKSATDNLLDCGFFQDSLKVAASKPIAIDCRLIAENK